MSHAYQRGLVRAAIAAVTILFHVTRSIAAESSTADVLTPAEREQFFQSYFDRLTEPKPLTRFRTKEEWLKHRAALREKILRSLGLSPLPERGPLLAKVTGGIDHEDYSVHRVYYQVFNQVYASGYLYLPAEARSSRPSAAAADNSARRTPHAALQTRFPAILNPHGHWEGGALHPVVQSRCIALAKMGYVAFCPDSTHVADFALGLCPIGLMTWNNMRALDFLESLPFVDRARIGCTGASGGGQQTMYLAALDERVKVIVPAVLVSYFRRILFPTEQAHCFCNHAPGILAATDEHEMAALFAPRPTRFITATGDWTKEFPKDEFPQIKHVFDLVGGAVDCVQFDKPHNYDQDSREQMYAWMNKYLKGIDDPAAAKEPPITPEEPAALKALDKTTEGIWGLTNAPAEYRMKYQFRSQRFHSRREWAAYLKSLRSSLHDLLGEDLPSAPLNPRSRGTAEVAGFKVEKLLFDSEPGVSVPAWLMAPNDRSAAPAIVIAHPLGKHALLRERAPLVRALLDRGLLVLAVDTRLRGELRRDWRWNEMIWGRPADGMAAHDLNCVAAYLRSRKDVDASRIFLLGLGDTGRSALFATALDSRWAGVALDSVGPLYSDSGATNVLPNVLRHGDLPQFAALIAPRPLWLNGAGERFDFTVKAYGASGSAGALRCTELTGDEFAAQLPEWLTVPRGAKLRNVTR